jgi:ubiquitin-like 1-activating enzyme E1 B
MTGRDEHLQTIFGKEILKTLHESKVLVVGAGGIGCELLKDLVMTGFHNIEVLDLDTIDLSNLNRQFLFQNEHIKQSKAIVARETVLKFNPKAIIVAHFDNIFNKKYNIEWFKQFKIVLNALDNVAARRHVNKMCLAAGIPLVESGTAGYLGQVSVHLKNLTKCYDCDPKEIEQKTYPVCTIRSTPSTPIHCIVWAKNYLFNALFGKLDEQEEDLDSKKTKENEKEIENMKKESKSLLKMRDSLGSADSYQKVFERVFVEDIKTLITMKDLWTTRKEPNLIQLQSKKLKINHTSLEFDQQVWTLEENIQVFKQSLNEIAQDLIKQRKKDPQVVFEFDKDDERFLNFVTSTANIRAIIFHIQPTSRFITKGNIKLNRNGRKHYPSNSYH